MKQLSKAIVIFLITLGIISIPSASFATNNDTDGFDPDGKYLETSKEKYWADSIRAEYESSTPEKGLETCLRGLLQVYGGSLEHLGKKTKATPDPKFQALINDFFRLKADLAVHRLARGYLLMQNEFDPQAVVQSSDAMADHIRRTKNMTDSNQFSTAALYYEAVLQDSAEMASKFNQEDGQGLDLLRTDFNKLFPNDKYLVETEDITLINFLNREYRRVSGKTDHGFFNKLIYSTFMAYKPDEKDKKWNIAGSLKEIAAHQDKLKSKISSKMGEILQFLREDEHFNCNQAGIEHDKMVAFIDRPEVSCRIFNELPFATGRGLLLPTNIKDAIKGLTYFGADALEPAPDNYYEQDKYWVRRGIENDPPAPAPEGPPKKLGLTPDPFDYSKNQHMGTIQVPDGIAPVNLTCSVVNHAENQSCLVIPPDATNNNYRISIILQSQDLYPLSVIVNGKYNSDKSYLPSDPVLFPWPFDLSLQVVGNVEGDNIKLTATPQPKVEGQVPAGAICQWKLGETIIEGQTALSITVDKPANEVHPQYTCNYGFKQGDNFIPLASANTTLDLSNEPLKVELRSQDLPEDKVKVTAVVTERGTVVPVAQLTYTWNPGGSECDPKSNDCRIFPKSEEPQKITVDVVKTAEPTKKGKGETEIPAKVIEAKIELAGEVKDKKVDVTATLTGLPKDAVLKWYRIKGKKPQAAADEVKHEEDTEPAVVAEKPPGTGTGPTGAGTGPTDSGAGPTDSSAPVVTEVSPETPEILSCSGVTCAVDRKETDDKVYAETIFPIGGTAKIKSNEVAIPKLEEKPTPELHDPKDDEEEEENPEPKKKSPGTFVPKPGNPVSRPVTPHTSGQRLYYKQW